MCVPFEVRVEQLQRLRRKRCPSLSLLRRFDPDEVGQVILPALVSGKAFTHYYSRDINAKIHKKKILYQPFFRLFHPSLQHRFDFLGALRRDIEFLEPEALISGWKTIYALKLYHSTCLGSIAALCVLIN